MLFVFLYSSVVSRFVWVGTQWSRGGLGVSRHTIYRSNKKNGFLLWSVIDREEASVSDRELACSGIH